MTIDTLTASITIPAPAQVVFAVLADPANHVAIDGTGWVRESLDGALLTTPGQVFRMAMYRNNPNFPDGNYEMANQVQVFDPPHAISWKPGRDIAGDGTLQFGEWIWRYDLDQITPSETTVTLTYDWSAVPPPVREHIPFPPFAPDHLDNSLAHLAAIVKGR
ncbi:SRPBCC family protein [Speluncibacter jeojiensis]|uniref:Polyketide cyclase n=1 Tax=Speluncibacter jeojiensis TaxID=2710754 RepID=A0A9X4M723_9ACTN|nr:polyketide cyclase [Corynebacteriales bacterium D3-21]